MTRRTWTAMTILPNVRSLQRMAVEDSTSAHLQFLSSSHQSMPWRQTNVSNEYRSSTAQWSPRPSARAPLPWKVSVPIPYNTLYTTWQDDSNAQHAIRSLAIQIHSASIFPCRLEPNVNHDSDLYGDPTMPPMTQCFLTRSLDNAWNAIVTSCVIANSECADKWNQCTAYKETTNWKSRDAAIDGYTTPKIS